MLDNDMLIRCEIVARIVKKFIWLFYILVFYDTSDWGVFIENVV